MVLESDTFLHFLMARRSVYRGTSKISVSQQTPNGTFLEQIYLTCETIPIYDVVPSAVMWYFGNDTKGIQRSAADCSPSGSSPLYDLSRITFLCDNKNQKYYMNISEPQSSDNDQCWRCRVAYNNFSAPNISSPACIQMKTQEDRHIARNTVHVPMSPETDEILSPFVVRNPVSLSMSPKPAKIGLPLYLECHLHPSYGDKSSDITWYRGNDTKGMKLSATDCSPSGSSLLYELHRYNYSCDHNDNIYRMKIPRLLDSDNGTCWTCGVASNNLPAPNKSARACIRMTTKPTYSNTDDKNPLYLLFLLVHIAFFIAYFYIYRKKILRDTNVGGGKGKEAKWQEKEEAEIMSV